MILSCNKIILQSVVSQVVICFVMQDCRTMIV